MAPIEFIFRKDLFPPSFTPMLTQLSLYLSCFIDLSCTVMNIERRVRRVSIKENFIALPSPTWSSK